MVMVIQTLFSNCKFSFPALKIIIYNNNKCPETSETCLHIDLFQVDSRMISNCFLWPLNYHCCVTAGVVKRTEAEKVGSYERRMSEEQNNESQKQKVPSRVGTH